MKIMISGGGIAGLTIAIALKRIGIQAQVYEAAPEIKAVGAGLVLAANAIKALKKLGIDEAVMAEGRLLDAFSIKNERGSIISQTNSLANREKYGADNFAIHRANLHRVLMSFAGPDNVLTAKQCVDVKRERKQLILYFSDGSSESADYLIAADGIHSPIRQKLLPQSKIRYAGYTCWRSVIDNPIPALSEASETWGAKGRFGIVPLAYGKLYWFACIKAKQNDARLQHFTAMDLLHQFGNYHSPIPEILQNSQTGDLLWNDIADLSPLPQYAFDNIVLTGDAAHATTPNMGQGACQAIEDAVILADKIQNSSAIPEAFRSFEKRRMARTQYIVKQSRLLGQIAQVQNNFVGSLRNTLIRCLPASAREKQLEKLLMVEF